ncbi:translation initiation factor eIF-2A [Fistulina hepatica ATCC 64428]|uniref:Eukaryotic translation initiation factor 2A n=1 Tax=Fistulina hepatica ATCC 64428 TaxID=1128425 RepID=A0A0D7AKM9_9AGAR|nr:translation initiation factor eIF-2A [Fistulina hepatica ATCC 64428]
MSAQYAFRAQKSLGLVSGGGGYLPIPGFEDPGVPARTYVYSSDGRLYAYVLPDVVRVFVAENAQLLRELAVRNVLELSFSPRGTYLSTWERPIKLEDGQQHKNLRVFSVSTGEELIAFTQKSQELWDLQYTISESHAVRLVGSDVQVYRPSEWDKGVVDKLRVEGATSVSLSPGLSPSITIFIAEKKGAPASVRIYNLLSLSAPPSCQKTFYKADCATIKWNTLGTQVLVLTQTDVDKTNKSYYGETGLYLLSATGNFDCRVTLDKEGPIHDFAWSPNSKEFGVVYGYMPAKTVLFNQRVRILHDFSSSPHNFISFDPHGRLLALAGFGNLAGKIDIFDRKTLNKVCTIDAPNTSHCEWSPDGRFLLTATLSPRLRVDNGLKIWHCTGALVHVQHTEELYQTSWRPIPVENTPAFTAAALPAAPIPSADAVHHQSVQKPVPTKSAGAYRPPGARGLATPSIYRREDEGGAPRVPTGGISTPPQSRTTSAGARRVVPGAAIKQESPEGSPPRETPAKNGKANGKMNGHVKSRPGSVSVPSPDLAVATPATPATPVDSTLDPVAKKIRNLSKKLKAIDELKEKAMRGERLEATQLKKMDGEADIRKELDALSVGPS